MIKKNNYYQMLRAIAIIAVILVHSCLDTKESSIIVFRQVINYCVALFVFLSGFLTTIKSIENIRDFYYKRINRVIIPYFIWSVVYTITNKDFSIISFIKKICTGQCCGIYYYILVYVQLVLLTPILIKMIHKNIGKLVWIITPITIIIEYVCAISGHEIKFPYNVVTFLPWILFYYYGLYLRNVQPIKVNLKSNIIAYIVFLCLAIAEGFTWNSYGFNSIGISQIKITSIFVSIYFINILINLEGKVKENNLLIDIGNISFGLYLFHVMVLNKLVKKIYIFDTFELFDAFMRTILVLIISYIIIKAIKFLLKDKSKYIGF